MPKHIHFKEIDSTSTYLKNNYEKYDNLTFVSASYQTSGHGRMNREWVNSRDEDLMFSVLIKDEEMISKFSSLSLMSAVVIYNLVKKHLGIHNCKIKWPNDVYINTQKVAGILLESISEGDKIKALVIGIGVNVNSLVFDVDSDVKPTSIALEYGKLVNLKSIRTYVFTNFVKEYLKLKAGNNEYLEICRNRNILKNQDVYASIKGKRELVKVLDINDDNSLKVIYNNEEYNISSDEITFHNKAQ